MDFEIDIYISHFIDKDNNSTYYQKWVDNFREYINWFIKKLIKRDLNIVSSFDMIQDEAISLNYVLKNAKCILIILSPEYTSSIQYQNEIQLFINQKSANTSIKNKVFKVCKYPIKPQDIPKEIQESFSYNLYFLNTENEEVREFHDFRGQEEENIFWFKVVDLCYDIYYQLKENKAANLKEPKSVYLAEASKDQIFHRDLIKRDFLMKGYNVLPHKHLRRKSLNELEQEILDYISQCEFSIHIFGDEPGQKVENTELSIVDFQNQVAAKFSQQKRSSENNQDDFYRFIWIPPNLKLYNQKQLNRINNLKRNMREIENAEIIESPLEVFRSIVRSRINEVATNKETKKIRNITNTNRHHIYIIFEYIEQNNLILKEIIDVLKANNIELLEPDYGNDQRILINEHKKKLVQADTILVFYNNTGVLWLKSKIQDILKAPGYGRIKPFISNCILINNDADNIINTIDVKEIENLQIKKENRKAIFEDYIRKLLNNLNG